MPLLGLKFHLHYHNTHFQKKKYPLIKKPPLASFYVHNTEEGKLLRDIDYKTILISF